MKTNTILKALALVALSTLTAPAHAALTLLPTTCASTDITPGALACSGFFEGNLLAGSPAAIADQTAALALIGFAWDGNFAAIEKIPSLGGAFSANFATPMNGITYVGFHFGRGGVNGRGGGTAFYKLDAGSNLDAIGLAYKASSGAALYSTGPSLAVPEPAAWAMLIAGFGVVGSAMRRRRRTFVTA